jgi:hypothetical protein
VKGKNDYSEILINLAINTKFNLILNLHSFWLCSIEIIFMCCQHVLFCVGYDAYSSFLLPRQDTLNADMKIPGIMLLVVSAGTNIRCLM